MPLAGITLAQLANMYRTDPGFRSRLSDLMRDPAGFFKSAVQDVTPTPKELMSAFVDASSPTLNGSVMLQPDADAAKQKMMNLSLAGITAYHGSPYKFDKFDMSKVGTGEGAQVYGHGLYFAEKPEVAGQYAKDLGRTVPAFNGKPTKDAAEGFAHDILSKYDPSIAKKVVDSYVDGGVFKGGDAEGMRQKIYAAIDKHSASDVGTASTGVTYKVDLPDEHIAKMLDWDKPLSEQAPDVRKALDGVIAKGLEQSNAAGKAIFEAAPKDPTGSELHTALSRLFGKTKFDQVAMTQALREAGIPGIRYLDGGSRGKGQGTYNYVVFDDSIPKIIGKD